ncbi:MAG: NADH-quinone oxidoreductase subunit NuoE [Phycisphaerae bacterium]|nr:NADH-quinone oxidoreductase subunit NuoE [Phycisphaerae bacterium]
MSTATQDKIQELRDFISQTREDAHPDSHLIAVLHKAQGLFGYLSRETMDLVAEQMRIPTAHIWGVATFYHYFKLSPPGRHQISLCLGTACYVKGGAQVLEALKKDLGVEVGQTTADGLFTLQEARCLGACGLAPVCMIDDKVYGELTPKKIVEILAKYRKDAKGKP